MKSLKNNYCVYVLSLTTANILFGFVPSLQKLTFVYGGSGLLTALYSALMGAIPFMLIAKRNHVSLIPDKTTAKKLCILCVGSVGTILCLWSSYSYIPVGVATTLHYVYPMVIAVSMTLFYKEPFTRENAVALLLTMCGIAAISVSDGTTLKPIGILLALISGFFWAFYIIYIEKSGLCKKSPILVNFYMTVANVPFTFIVCLLSGKLGVYSVPWAWGIIVIVAVLHRGIAYGLFQFGLRGVPPVSAGVLCTFEPVSALIFGVLLLGERISLRQFVGLVLVLLGICVNLLTNRKSSKRCVEN